MRFGKLTYGFNFEDHGVKDHKVCIKIMRKNNVLVMNFELFFMFEWNLPLPEFILQCIFVNDLRKTMS